MRIHKLPYRLTSKAIRLQDFFQSRISNKGNNLYRTGN